MTFYSNLVETMRPFRTIFDILSLIFQRNRGHVTVTTPLSGKICRRRLGLAMFQPHTKFEVSTITCNEEMNDNAK